MQLAANTGDRRRLGLRQHIDGLPSRLQGCSQFRVGRGLVRIMLVLRVQLPKPQAADPVPGRSRSNTMVM
jgi:hypothetical protein